MVHEHSASVYGRNNMLRFFISTSSLNITSNSLPKFSTTLTELLGSNKTSGQKEYRVALMFQEISDRLLNGYFLLCRRKELWDRDVLRYENKRECEDVPVHQRRRVEVPKQGTSLKYDFKENV